MSLDGVLSIRGKSDRLVHVPPERTSSDIWAKTLPKQPDWLAMLERTNSLRSVWQIQPPTPYLEVESVISLGDNTSAENLAP